LQQMYTNMVYPPAQPYAYTTPTFEAQMTTTGAAFGGIGAQGDMPNVVDAVKFDEADNDEQ